MKKFYIVVQTENASKEWYSYIIVAFENDNINYLLKRVDGLVTANIYGSKKVASFVCNTYNNNYINAGNHAFIGQDKPF